ncbi:phosphoribosyltransferase [Nostoc sp. FACHB-87]|uniref:phosphoribosyltransferase n=1 Tax=Nostocales TaxID=1161 RepID=UPI001683FDE7|nr:MULTISPECIES: phosphoribosyltransferase [Nostocales]MBD2299117.1 phosphoribosyltransferase [Nostoc sp. FACHB-190]MBD2456805.1 phosphoribosyltransferase [Nostoc sp. FACHB-87]MBD2476426.1 phosphoribosyltransferase [Anabaena sp. FACHB-83]MBD2488369.1 phosphoribosyltransferase [Aulosira sp. FACHB-615]
MTSKFRDRSDAGKMLAKKLTAYTNHPDLLVLGLPRGGVPVAYEIATSLNAPLDICLVRKLGVPGHEELAMGAIAAGGVRVLNYDVINNLAIDSTTIDKVATQELWELQRRDRAYRGERPLPDIKNRTVILVDDGIATGSTMLAAIAVVKQQQPQRLIVAVPIAAPTTCQQLQAEVDEIVCLVMPESLYAIGLWYEDFSQTTDVEVQHLLAKHSVINNADKSYA